MPPHCAHSHGRKRAQSFPCDDSAHPGPRLPCQMIAIAMCAVAVSCTPNVRSDDAQSQSRVSNLVIATIDGLRWREVFEGADLQLLKADKEKPWKIARAVERFWRESKEARRAALLPFIWRTVGRDAHWFGNIASGNDAKALNATGSSYPSYHELLTGFVDARIRSNARVRNPNRTVLEWLASRPGFSTRVAAFCSWDAFQFILDDDRGSLFINAGRQELALEAASSRLSMFNFLQAETNHPDLTVRHDAFTSAAALEYVKAKRPRVLYLSLGETDEFAHEGKYGRYLDAASRWDRAIGLLWNELQSDSQYRDRTALILATDHGRGENEQWVTHGRDIPGAENVWIAVYSPDSSPGADPPEARKVTLGQVAATAAALLGEDYLANVPKAAPPLPGVLMQTAPPSHARFLR